MNVIKRNQANRVFPSSMDELFRDLMGGTQYVQKKIPPVNVKETEGAYILELAAPGFSKESFKIELDNGLMTISAEVGHKENESETRFTRKEFNLSSFKRAFTLPETVNEAGVNAIYKEGVLEVTLPKKEEALPKEKRSVEIS